MECHHLVEKRLISALKGCDSTLTEGKFLATPLNPQAHQVFTNLWRQNLPYRQSYSTDQIVSATQTVYRDYPTLLNATNKWLESIGAK